MSDPFEKFKKQLKQNNAVEEILEDIDSISAAEFGGEENDSMITQKYVERYLNLLDLTPYITGAAQPKLNQKNL